MQVCKCQLQLFQKELQPLQLHLWLQSGPLRLQAMHSYSVFTLARNSLFMQRLRASVQLTLAREAAAW